MEKKKKRTWLWLLPVPFLVAALVMGALALREQLALNRIPALQNTDLVQLCPESGHMQQSEAGQRLYEGELAGWQLWLDGEAVYEGKSKERTVSQQVVLNALDIELLEQSLREDMAQRLKNAVMAAKRSDEVYGEDGAWYSEQSRAAFTEALAARAADPSALQSRQSFGLTFDWNGESWQPRRDSELDRLQETALSVSRDADKTAEALYEATVGTLEPVYKSYAPLGEYDLMGPEPTAEYFNETYDPQEVAALLRTATAQHLIGDQETVWNPDIELYPDTPIRTYLDDTILVIVWQEVVANAQGTYAEVFVSDPSQFRRKIAGNRLSSFEFATTSEYARDTNGILTLGGDFYHHARNCGINVYQRLISRYDMDTCDTCYITAGGDLLFSYRYQFYSYEQVDQFVADNDVVFSLAFGPALIENGEDVTPLTYPWGEIDEYFARSVLGQMGKLHYLTLNINCDATGHTRYNNLVTLWDARDAMVGKGCLMAYTLDGGQTATTVFNGKLINQVQFGWEKPISDAIYFATAVPD